MAAERKALMQAASGLVVRVVDAEVSYLWHRARSSRALEVGPYDRHLNESGVKLLMERAALELR